MHMSAAGSGGPGEAPGPHGASAGPQGVRESVTHAACLPGPWARSAVRGWGFQTVQGQAESLRGAGREEQRIQGSEVARQGAAEGSGFCYS